MGKTTSVLFSFYFFVECRREYLIGVADYSSLWFETDQIRKVLRKSNGYFVDSSQVANDGVPFIFTVGDGTAIAGVDEGVQGMSTGGVRRLLIPPSLAYVDGLEDGKPGPLPVGFGPR
jgi:hypothetical protein